VVLGDVGDLSLLNEGASLLVLRDLDEGSDADGGGDACAPVGVEVAVDPFRRASQG
jgi:hypothetical protein